MSALVPARAATRVLRSGLVRRGRLVFTGVAGAAVVALALAGNVTDGSRGDIGEILIDAGLMFLVPVVTLTFAAAVIGDLVEDETLVYLWLRPLPRWHLAGASLAACLQVVLPLLLGVMALACVISGEPDLTLPLLLATSGAVLAYGSLFVALGTRTKRPLVYGLLYIVIWEGLLSSIAAPFARLSLRRYVVTLFTRNVTGVSARQFQTSTEHALVVLLVVTVAGALLTTWFLHRDVD